jgi:hypothetical protein
MATGQITDTLIQPPEALLIEVTDPSTNQTDYAFPLQTAAWLKMQGVVATALAFPLTQTDFTNTYGTFSDEGMVETALTILGTINTTAAKYGDPTTLISSLESFQQAGTAPSSIYGNAVWLAAQTQLAAQQIGSLLNQGLTDIGQNPDPGTRITELTELLTGQGGINSYASTLQGYIGAFETTVTAFYNELNGELTGPTNSLQWYLNQSNNILSDAKAAEATDAQTIDQLNSTIKQLNDEYVGFTVAASVSPVLLLVPFAGPFLAVADATTFAVLATKVKSQLDAAQARLDQVSDDDKKKQALIAVLGQFNLSAGDVETDGQDFLNTISTMISGWSEFQNQIKLRVGALTEDDVKNWDAFMTQLGFQTALTGWNLVAEKAESFYQTGFVQFSTQSSN